MARILYHREMILLFHYCFCLSLPFSTAVPLSLIHICRRVAIQHWQPEAAFVWSAKRYCGFVGAHAPLNNWKSNQAKFSTAPAEVSPRGEVRTTLVVERTVRSCKIYGSAFSLPSAPEYHVMSSAARLGGRVAMCKVEARQFTWGTTLVANIVIRI